MRILSFKLCQILESDDGMFFKSILLPNAVRMAALES